MQLGQEQIEALDGIKDFIENSKDTGIILFGSAGTGKSYVLSYLLKWIKGKYRYCLVAPTHKAALVMERYTKQEALTLHKLLALSPQIDIFALDMNDLMFMSSSAEVAIPKKGIVICDEASMINDDLYDTLIAKCQERKSKVLFLGDIKQLIPVKGSTVSKVFKLKNKFELTKIYRQSENNPIMPILNELREHPISSFKTIVGKEGNLFVDKDVKTFCLNARDALSSAIRNQDILATKILAYTNKRVEAYNKLMHKSLFDAEQYDLHDFLTCYDSIEYDGYQFYNSMDYIISSNPIKEDIYIDEFGYLPGFVFDLYDDLYKKSSEIKILSNEVDNTTRELLARCIENLRITAIKGNKSKIRGKLWGRYFKCINSFTTPFDLYFDNRVIKKKTFDYGYAITSHKSQGSSYNEVFVDMQDINSCRDNLVRRQLQYVAMSRTRSNVYLYQ